MTAGPTVLLPIGPRTAAPIPLPEGGCLTIGRDPSCDLVLAAGDAGRRHAMLEEEDRGWVVRDLETLNGTYVNGKRVKERVLRPGDEIRLANDSRYRFLVDRAEPEWPGRLRSLVRLELRARDPEFEPKNVRIGVAPLIVGRGAEADLRIDASNVSQPHARLESRGGQPWVVDHKSRNGTWVNGRRVAESPLRPGDEVAFADRPFDVHLNWAPSHRGLIAVAAAAVVVVVAILGSFLLRPEPSGVKGLWTRQMYEEQAEISLTEALQALDQRPAAVEIARAHFDITVRSLIAADRLRPDRQTPDDLREAFAGIRKGVGGAEAYEAYRSLAARSAPRAVVVDREAVVEIELSRILAEFGIDTTVQPIPPDLLAMVESYVDVWTGRMRDYTRRAIRRSEPYMGLITGELRANHLPVVFSHLPFVESGYQLEVSSPAGARGMWQFVPKTARSYGLEVTDSVDQRTDPVLSTRAACRYIDGLLSAFGADAFMCAVAAYNKGEYGMVTCLKKISWRSRWKFWELVRLNDGCLRQETIEYVPKFLAAAIVMRHPDVFGLLDEPETEAGEKR